MADFSQNVRALSDAAWRLRASNPHPCALPFSLVLFSDDRRQIDFISILKQLPSSLHLPPIAILFRHDSLAPKDRYALAQHARRLTQSKGHIFLMARGHLPGADGNHAHRGPGLNSIPVHSIREGISEQYRQIDFGFVSPVFRTRSHPDAVPLGPMKAAAIARAQHFPCFALGGMDLASTKSLYGSIFQGIGAIGALTDQLKT